MYRFPLPFTVFLNFILLISFVVQFLNICIKSHLSIFLFAKTHMKCKNILSIFLPFRRSNLGFRACKASALPLNYIHKSSMRSALFPSVSPSFPLSPLPPLSLSPPPFFLSPSLVVPLCYSTTLCKYSTTEYSSNLNCLFLFCCLDFRYHIQYHCCLFNFTVLK